MPHRPVIDTPPSNVTACFGDDARLECRYMRGDRTSRMQWTRQPAYVNGSYVNQSQAEAPWHYMVSINPKMCRCVSRLDELAMMYMKGVSLCAWTLLGLVHFEWEIGYDVGLHRDTCY